MHKRYGFTAVELVVVMIIMGILLTLAVVSFRSSQVQVRDNEREMDVQAIANYLERIYPQEIRDSSGQLLKSAGTYPALPAETTDGTSELEFIFSDLDPAVLTPPGVSQSRKIPTIPFGSEFIPNSSTSNAFCHLYINCYRRPVNVNPTKDEYVYAPGPADNDLCTKPNVITTQIFTTVNCRRFVLIYRTEGTNERIVVESKHK